MERSIRKKQPEVTRRLLLQCAEEILERDGFAAVSIQSVATAAGVTKGGLFHHFQSKQLLVEAMFGQVLDRVDDAIDTRIDPDVSAFGRFTRAYVKAVFADRDIAPSRSCGALSSAMLAEPWLHKMWGAWIADRMQKHRSTDDHPMLAIVRLAADGVWFGGVPAYGADRLEERLLGLTYKGARSAKEIEQDDLLLAPVLAIAREKQRGPSGENE